MNGHCTDAKECERKFEEVSEFDPNVLSYTFDPTLCTMVTDPTGEPTQRCGCCYFEIITEPPSVDEPCVQTSECEENGGKCKSYDECKRNFPNGNFKWEPHFCNALTTDPDGTDPDDRECGCCMPVTPPPSVDEPCVQTSECKENGGKCKSYDECKRNFPNGNFKWEPHFCNALTTDPDDRECGCCMPVTPPPSVDEPCEQTDRCEEKNGKCVTYDECKKHFPNGGFRFEHHLCHKQPATAALSDTQSPCGCCYKEDVTPPPSIDEPCEQTDRCEEKNGKCVTYDECKEHFPNGGFRFEHHLCHKQPATAGFSDSQSPCGCCYKEDVTPPPSIDEPCEQTDRCEEKNGKCVTYDECKEHFPNGGFRFEHHLCHKQPATAGFSDSQSPCGCCYKEDVTPPPSVDEPCVQTSECKENGGKCKSYDECKRNFPNGNFKWEPHFCNALTTDPDDRECGCCMPVTPPPSVDEPCEQTDRCEEKNGKCVTYDECKKHFPNGGFRFEHHLCHKQPATAALSDTQSPCGCCYKEDVTPPPSVNAPCYQTASCKRANGVCMDYHRCKVFHGEGNFVWDQKLCVQDGNAKDCGCCRKIQTPPPTVEKPCDQNRRCKRLGGKCMDYESCKKNFADQGFRWVEKICRDTKTKECGCCVPNDPTPPPTVEKPCDQNSRCKRLGGKCMDYESCKKNFADQGFRWVEKICRDTKTKECGCCVPNDPTPPPTVEKPCDQNSRCKRLGGKCMDYESCKKNFADQGFRWVEKICRDTKTKECGCCVPNDPTPPPTVEKPCDQNSRCKRLGGKCMDYESCKKNFANQGFRWVEKICRDTKTKECGCCVPADTTPPPTIEKPCVQNRRCNRVGGKCMDYESCKSTFAEQGFKWVERICRDTKTKECGCCIPRITVPAVVSGPCVQTEKCADVNGACMSRKECRAYGKEIGQRLKFSAKLCKAEGGANRRCGCCFQKQ